MEQMELQAEISRKKLQTVKKDCKSEGNVEAE